MGASKATRLYVLLLIVLAASVVPTVSWADHHKCNDPPGTGIDTCVSAIIGAVTADQDPDNVLTFDLGSVLAGSSTTRDLTLGFTNNAGFISSLTSIDFAGDDADDFRWTGGTCIIGQDMPKKSTCTVSITFSPSTVGDKQAVILASTSDMTRTTNLIGSATLPAPQITSPLIDSGTSGVDYSYQITADYSPDSFSASELPPGLSINVSGKISGFPTSDGVYNSTITATNTTGTDTQTLVITIEPNVPGITSAASISGTTGQAFSYQITATNSPSSYNAINLPPGITVNTVTGLLSGTPSTGGSYTTASVSATNAIGTANQLVNINISPVVPTSEDTTLEVTINSAVNLDLTPFIDGPFVNSITIESEPSHGTAEVAGTLVTYTPDRDYFGSDSFTFSAINNDGSSSASTVSITVTGRPDPSKNTDVGGIIESQVLMNNRFARSQISNFSQRMEALHQNRGTSAQQSVQNFRLEMNKGALQAGMQQTVNSDSLHTADSPRNDFETQQAKRETPLFGSLIETLRYAAITGTFDLSYSSDINNLVMPRSTNFWVGGNISFGSRESTSAAQQLSFSTDGISFGADHQFSDKLYLGAGLGYAQGETLIGPDGSKNESKGNSLTLYGSYMPTNRLFIDSLLGYGQLEHDITRYVSPIDSFARTKREGDQLFGSISAGYHFRQPGMTFSPYGRFETVISELDDATESGVGDYALSYQTESQTSSLLSLGFRAKSLHKTRFGWAQPHLRIEINHRLDEDSDTDIIYTDLGVTGSRYRLGTDGMQENTVLMGIGSDFIFRQGTKLSLDFQTIDSSGPQHEQMFNIWLTKNFNEKISLLNMVESNPSGLPVNIQLGVSYDDNLNRAAQTENSISDKILDFSISTRSTLGLGRKSRLVLSASAVGERLYTYHDLERNSVKLKAEYQYRTSASYDALTFAVNGSWYYENYVSDIRDKDGHSIGVSARQDLTDRIHWMAELSTKKLSADEEVFDIDRKALQFNIDYSLGGSGSLYLSQGFHKGFSVSSNPELIYGDSALSVIDDAFERHGVPAYTATRFDSEITMTTLGYNIPLGSKDSIDISFRRIKSTADDNTVGNASYQSEQFSLYYLTRF